MKTPSHDLFLLINSMSKTEKRYFKKFSELHGKQDNKYLLLFDAMAKQKEFDEESIKKQFKGQAFLKQFPVAKNYLYSRILDALEFYHRDSSTHSTVRRNIYRAELLQKKGLYDQSMKTLQRARKDANELELFHALLEIQTQWEFNAYLEQYDLPNLEKLIEETAKTSELLSDTLICRSLSLQMVNLYNHYYRTRNKKIIEQAEDLMKSPYFKKAEEIKTFSGKLRIYEAKFFFWYAKGNLDAACMEGEKAAALCLSSPAHMKNNIKLYMVLLSNLFYVRSEQKKYDGAYEFLKKLAATFDYARTYSLRAKYFYLHDNALLHYLYHTGKLKELEKKIFAVITELEKHTDELSNYEKIALLTNISISFFYLGNLKQSIHYMNILRNEFDMSVNPEAQYFLNIFYLIAHYDSGHHEILPYLVQSFHRFLLKKSHISKVETVMMDLLKKLPQSDKEKNPVEAFSAVKKELENVPKDKMHYYIFKYFDIVSWLESKIKNKSFQEVIREKTK
ncbi:MAG: hypothetical protein HY841_04140 [Bacteroidetes bacterium]|nr:hypothetical protein [Bacteroidota bacterium]